MAIDAAGNAYVGGSTNETDFPTTPGAFMTKGGIVGASSFGDVFYYSFAVKISPAGKLVFSTLLGTGADGCNGGSACIGSSRAWLMSKVWQWIARVLLQQRA
jgi:hypothetical protein